MKFRCRLCGDIVDGGQKGRLITCRCGAVAIDETPYYCRIIGNIENYEEIKDKE